MADARDDAGLVERLKGGDGAAFEELIRTYGPRLLLKARHMLGNPDDARDCVQDCYVQVHRNIGSFRGEASLYSWMYRILVNSCLKKMQSRSRGELVPIDELMPEFDSDGCRIEPMWQTLPSGEDLVEQNDTRARVLAAIRDLPAGYRDVLYLRDIEGHSTAEVSDMLGLSESATKVRLHRARAALKKLLEPLFWERQKP